LSLAIMFEAFKYVKHSAFSESFTIFCSLFESCCKRNGFNHSTIRFKVVLDLINEITSYLYPSDQTIDRSNRLFLLNIDETNSMLISDAKREFFGSVLIRIFEQLFRRNAFIVLILTGTSNIKLHDIVTRSRVTSQSISFPTLEIEQSSEILTQFVRCLPPPSNFNFEYNNSAYPDAPHLLENPYFQYVIHLLGGVPRYIEELLNVLGSRELDNANFGNNMQSQEHLSLSQDLQHEFTNNYLNSNRKRRRNSTNFRAQNASNVFFHPSLSYFTVWSIYEQTIQNIQKRYDYSTRFRHPQIKLRMLSLVGYALFQWDCQHAEPICSVAEKVDSMSEKHPASSDSVVSYNLPKEPRSIESAEEFTFGRFEQNGIIFLQQSKESNDFKVHLPFVLISIFYQMYSRTQSKVAYSPLLSIQPSMNFEENEISDLAIIMMKLQILKSHDPDQTHFKLSTVFPLHSNQSEQYIKFPKFFGFNRLDHQVKGKTWNDFVEGKGLFSGRIDQEKYHKIGAYLNAGSAPFADSIILTDPYIFMQNKQSVSARKDKIAGKPPASSRTLNDVQKEHNKCNINVDHIFVFITDERFIMPPNDASPSLLDNEIIISSDNEKQFYGDILTRRKMFCIDHSKNSNINS